MDIDFDIVNQTVERSDKHKMVNWSDDYLRLVFSFKSSDWSDCSKFILVFDGGEVYRFALSNNAFIVPEELLTDVKLVFSVYGVNNSYRITTPKVMLRLLEAGYSADVKTLDVEEFTHDVVEEVYIAIDGKADLVHTHTESDITDLKNYSEVGHTHTKSDVTDFSHTHTKSEISDFSHNHDDRYYTESEIDTKLSNKADSTHTHTKSQITDFNHNHDDRYYTETEVNALIYGMNNKIGFDGDKTILQTGDTVNLRAYVVENGMPQKNKVVNFYINEEELEE